MPQLKETEPRRIGDNGSRTPDSCLDRDARRVRLLRRFLNAYWLRPENALWMALRSEALSTVPMTPPAIDVCCGDGLFSFLHAGGQLDESFDVFTGVARSRPEAPTADMFDDAPDSYRPKIARAPEFRIDTGLDLKDALLQKASRLKFYSRLVRHDTNQPLPLPDASYQTIYCNAAYWVENIDDFLRELRRIATADARVVLQIKLDCLRDYTLEPFRDQLGDAFLQLIARGRLDCYPSLADEATWLARFERAGLRVLERRPFVTRTHAHIWDIGLRPLAPMLVRLANGVDDATRLAVKRDWVATCETLFGPFLNTTINLFSTESTPAEVQFVLGVP